MTPKSAGLILGLLVATSFGSSAAPLPKPGAMVLETTIAHSVRYTYRYYRPRFHRSYWRRYWLQPDFWGRYRYIGPYSNRVNTHMY